MRIAALLTALALAVAAAAPASACIVPPRGEAIFWTEAPAQLDPGDIVLEVRFRDYLKAAPPKSKNGEEVIIVTSCGSDRSAVYDVLRVAKGAFTASHVSLGPFSEFQEPEAYVDRPVHLVILKTGGYRDDASISPTAPPEKSAGLSGWTFAEVRLPPPEYVTEQ